MTIKNGVRCVVLVGCTLAVAAGMGCGAAPGDGVVSDETAPVAPQGKVGAEVGSSGAALGPASAQTSLSPVLACYSDFSFNDPDKFCGNFYPECSECVGDPSCPTGARTRNVMTRGCFGCSDTFNPACPWLGQEYKDFGDCGCF
jgi:hypothetical protein